MGEKIANLGKISLRECNIDVEINHPLSAGMPRQIHIQSNNFRFELNEDEFIRLVSAVLLAKEKLKRQKKIDELL